MTDDTKLTNPKDHFGSAKVPVGLVPQTAITEMALGFLEGALKYGRYNWRVAGVRGSIYTDAAFRHLFKYINGQDRDPDTKVRELASVMCCCAIIIDAEICGMLNDDRPPLAPMGPLLDADLEVVAHLKELFKDHHPHQYVWADSPQVKALNESMQAGLREALGAGPLEPEGFPDGYSLHVADPTPESMASREAPAVTLTMPGPLVLDCGCVKRCKGHPVSLDAAKVDVPASPGNYAAERAAGPKDPQGRPYASTTADAEFPHPPPVHRPVEAAREFDPAD